MARLACSLLLLAAYSKAAVLELVGDSENSLLFVNATTTDEVKIGVQNGMLVSTTDIMIENLRVKAELDSLLTRVRALEEHLSLAAPSAPPSAGGRRLEEPQSVEFSLGFLVNPQPQAVAAAVRDYFNAGCSAQCVTKARVTIAGTAAKIVLFESGAISTSTIIASIAKPAALVKALGAKLNSPQLQVIDAPALEDKKASKVAVLSFLYKSGYSVANSLNSCAVGGGGAANLCMSCAKPAAAESTTCNGVGSGIAQNVNDATALSDYAIKCFNDANCKGFTWDQWSRVILVNTVAKDAVDSTATGKLDISGISSFTKPANGYVTFWKSA